MNPTPLLCAGSIKRRTLPTSRREEFKYVHHQEIVKYKVTDQCIWCDIYPMHTQIKTLHCASEIGIKYIPIQKEEKALHSGSIVANEVYPRCDYCWEKKRKRIAPTSDTLVLEKCQWLPSLSSSQAPAFPFIQLSWFTHRLLYLLCNCTLGSLFCLYQARIPNFLVAHLPECPPGMSHIEESHQSTFPLCIMPVSFQYLYWTNHPAPGVWSSSPLNPFLCLLLC